jgi:hypothetical protein
MRVLTIRGKPKGVSMSQEANASRIRVPAQTWPQATSSFLDISKENDLIAIVRADRTF